MTRLSDDQIAEALGSLPGWERSGDQILRTIAFPAFLDGIGFVNQVAEMAEAANHHPDIDIRYRRVRFVLTTHDEGGLTEKDVQLARRINEFLGYPSVRGSP